MSIHLAGASRLTLALLFLPTAALAEEGEGHDTKRHDDVLVVAQREAAAIEQAPNTRASVTAEQIQTTINAVNVEDTLKYLPSLVVRKRHIGDTQSPLATRTSGVGASARSLVYADGALLSALIGNNNTSASPRWQLVGPQEISRIDVLYGPFSAAYPGNSIGAVVNITTRLPDKLEASVDGGVSVQNFDQYATSQTLPSYSIGGTIGDRFGPLAVFASASHVSSRAQPLAYATAVRPANTSTTGTPTTGGFDDLNRAGQPIRVLGATGIESQQQSFFKFKAALNLPLHMHLVYVGGLFVNDTEATAEPYAFTASGTPAYAGTFNIGGYAYSVPASTFSNNVYTVAQRHWSQSLSLTGDGERFDWQIIATLFDFAKDVQRVPSATLPAGFAGGAGNIIRLDGTGWSTIDAKAAWRPSNHVISFGYHRDRFTLASNRYSTTDWRIGSEGALNQASRGRTQTDALWLQDAWTIVPTLTLTVGGRYEWWRASNGFNFAATPAFAVNQPQLSANRFSPKASLRWQTTPDWRLTASFGQAYRFPTVSELYQAVTTGPTITSPNPNLRPENALSEEISVQYGPDGRYVRLSLFNEEIKDALLSQSAPLVPGSTTLFNYVQNVDRVLTRGLELAFQQTDLLPRFDLSGNLTLIDPRIRANTAFPAAIGKRPPQLPTRKATLVATWRPDDATALTAALRHASRSFGTIDNSDPIANTFQGFDGYTVVDLRASFRVAKQWRLAFGVDNVTGAKYFIFHPFPQRSFVAELHWQL